MLHREIRHFLQIVVQQNLFFCKLRKMAWKKMMILLEKMELISVTIAGFSYFNGE